VYYQVNDQKFANKFLAARHAMNTGGQLHFNLYEDTFDRADWSQEPKESWDTLLDRRARQIASMNKPIVFYFSGGTDSYTIYQVFKRNNIHIDVAYIRSWSTETHLQQPVIDLMNLDWYDPHTKMIFRDGTELIKNHSYLSPDWIWEKGYRYQFGFVGTDEQSNDEISALLGTDDFVAVLGFEKPRLKFTATGVYSYQDDENYVRTMSDPRMDCFYISPQLPELHIKQSYMLLNYIRTLAPWGKTPGQLDIYNIIHNPAKFDWLKYSFNGCGRFGDINQSHIAHIINGKTKLAIPESGKFTGSEYFGRAAPWFKEYADTKIFKNYIDGIMSVTNDAAGKYLITDPTNFYSMKQYTSKGHQLTF
jgi:hypothetical protein